MGKRASGDPSTAGGTAATSSAKHHGPADEVLRTIRRIVRRITIHSKQFYRETGVTIPQWLCLRAIDSFGERRPGAVEVARLLQLSPPTLTGILTRLERDGLVERAPHPSDRRRIALGITAPARTLLEGHAAPLHDRFVRRFLSLPPGDQQRIVDSLQQVAELMDASELEASPILITEDVSNTPS